MLDEDGPNTAAEAEPAAEEREKFWWDDNGAEMTFVENMRMLRERRGMSQTEFAKKASEEGLTFHQPTVQRIETGQRPLKLTESLVIARILGSSLEQMMNDTSLPFAYSLLVQSTSWEELEQRINLLIQSRGVKYTIRQIEEHLQDYQLAAATFGEKPIADVLDRAEIVLEHLRRIQSALDTAASTIADITGELQELPPMPVQAHGGTPWDDEADG